MKGTASTSVSPARPLPWNVSNVSPPRGFVGIQYPYQTCSVDDIRIVGKKRRLQVQRLVFAHFRFEDTGQFFDVLMYQILHARDGALREQRRVRNSPPSVKVMFECTVDYGGRCIHGQILILIHRLFSTYFQEVRQPFPRMEGICSVSWGWARICGSRPG